MGNRIALAGLCILLWAGCAPCGKDSLEPNDSEADAYDAGEVNFELNELDVNFHNSTDVDCLSFSIPDPSSAESPTLYIEVKDETEILDMSLTFTCASGDPPAAFTCTGEIPDDPTCAANGKAPKMNITYDCDDTSDTALGDSSFVLCLSRPDYKAECIDYTLRVYLN